LAGVTILIHANPVEDSHSAKDKIIVALDVPSVLQARQLIELLGGKAGWFKVGLQLFCAAGPTIIQEVKQTGSRVFLDLKFYDIPNTVRSAVAATSALGIEMLTIHLVGGSEMCVAAVTGRARSNVLLLGVTILTSQVDDNLHEVGFRTTVVNQVLLLAELAKNCGIPGLVASPHELKPLRHRFGSLFTIVTPGVRPSWAEAGDQKRIMTPLEAIQAGADFLVIGRPITAAPNPKEALERILEEITV
jgi:orotidine-5'-phosphate decarboxylase